MLLLAFEVCFSILTLRFPFCGGGGGVCFCVCVCVVLESSIKNLQPH